MSILDNIYGAAKSTQAELKGMNAALKGMAAADKKEYALDSKDRKYEREKDKREAQDRKEFNKKVFSSVDDQTKEIGKKEQGKKLAAGLASATASAIAETVKKNKDKKKSQQEPAGTGGPAGISMSPREVSQTPTRIEPKNDHEERLFELEQTVFNFPQQKVQKLQSGGFAGAVPNLGQPGTGDHFYTHVEPGSYVLNRNAVSAMGFQGGGNVPVALEQGEIVVPPGQYDQKMMDFINYAAAPRFQSGGEVNKMKKGGDKTTNENRIAYSPAIDIDTSKFQKRQKGGKMYLHWTASPYNANFPAYHTVFDGEGTPKRNHPYDKRSGGGLGHTLGRNAGGVGMSLASMAGPDSDPWKKDPPTQKQFDAMAAEIAALAKKWDWAIGDINAANVMTHAEAAKHDGYFGERWDLLQLRKGDPDWSGGKKLRSLAQAKFKGETIDLDAITGVDQPRGSNNNISANDGTIPTQQGSKGVGGFKGPFAEMFKAIDKEVFGGGKNKYGLSLGMLLNPEAALGDMLTVDGALGNVLNGGGDNKDNKDNKNNDTSNVEAAQISGSTLERARMMYNYAKSLGLTSAQAKGLVANIQRESNFNPKEKSGDDGGPGGLFQWKGVRQTPEVAKLVNSGDWKGQIKYALKEDAGPRYRGETANMDALGASKWWMEKWERPADPAAGHRKHASFIKSYNFQKGGMVKLLSRAVGVDLDQFFQQSDQQLMHQAMGDSEPVVINMGEDAPEPQITAHTSGSNMPNYNLATRDSCPLSVYYRYHPSLNPQGMNP